MKSLIGQTFGRLRVTRQVAGTGKGARWAASCSCGGQTEVDGYLLVGDAVKSCGCLVRENLAHIDPRVGPTRTYRIWNTMIAGCRNPGISLFRVYGGMGVTVTDNWLTFAGFLSDMGESPDFTALEREDGGGNFEPTNCSWGNWHGQCNKRADRRVTYQGEAMTEVEFARCIGMGQRTVHYRLESGWTPDAVARTLIPTPETGGVEPKVVNNCKRAPGVRDYSYD